MLLDPLLGMRNAFAFEELARLALEHFEIFIHPGGRFDLERSHRI
jgi:hypothetical protein